MASIVRERAARLFDNLTAEDEPFNGLRSHPKAYSRQYKIKNIELADEIDNDTSIAQEWPQSPARNTVKSRQHSQVHTTGTRHTVYTEDEERQHPSTIAGDLAAPIAANIGRSDQVRNAGPSQSVLGPAAAATAACASPIGGQLEDLSLLGTLLEAGVAPAQDDGTLLRV